MSPLRISPHLTIPLLSTKPVIRVRAQHSLTAKILGLRSSERDYLPSIYYIKELQDLANKYHRSQSACMGLGPEHAGSRERNIKLDKGASIDMRNSLVI